MLNSCTPSVEQRFVGRRGKGQPVVNMVERSYGGEEGAKDLRGLNNAFALSVVCAQSVFVLSMFDPSIIVKTAAEKEQIDR